MHEQVLRWFRQDRQAVEEWCREAGVPVAVVALCSGLYEVGDMVLFQAMKTLETFETDPSTGDLREDVIDAIRCLEERSKERRRLVGYQIESVRRVPYPFFVLATEQNPSVIRLDQDRALVLLGTYWPKP